jgi:hypothetical protein
MRLPNVRFSVRWMLLAIAFSAVFIYYVAVPAWHYYRLPPETRRVLGRLRMPMTLTVNGTRPPVLVDLLRQIRVASTGPKDNGIPIYLDPVGLDEAEQSTTSPIDVSTDVGTIRDHLERSLPALGLDYYIKDGLLTITSSKSAKRALLDQPNDAKHP